MRADAGRLVAAQGATHDRAHSLSQKGYGTIRADPERLQSDAIRVNGGTGRCSPSKQWYVSGMLKECSWACSRNAAFLSGWTWLWWASQRYGFNVEKPVAFCEKKQNKTNQNIKQAFLHDNLKGNNY